MFHVEISSGFHRARVFNLNDGDLAAKVVEPWLADLPIELGDREWEPRDSTLKILEGPHMETADLSFGQGWANAERASEILTRGVLSRAPQPRQPEAFVIEAAAPAALAAAIAAEHGGGAAEWSAAGRLVDGRNPEVAAVILLVKPPRD